MALEEKLDVVNGINDGRYRYNAKSLVGGLVNIASGVSYYTVIFGAQELALGNDFYKVLKTRALSLGVHVVFGYPVGILRDYVAQKMDVTKESPFIDKLKVNLIAITPVQSVTYAGMLLGAMAWSGDRDFKSSFYTWLIGVGCGMFHAEFSGRFQDWTRMKLGVAPAIESRKTD